MMMGHEGYEGIWDDDVCLALLDQVCLSVLFKLMIACDGFAMRYPPFI